MAFGFKRTIQGKGPDRFIINLRDDLREVIAAVCEDVLGALDDEGAPNRDPMLRRVFPVAHTSDESVNEAYRDLVQSDLLRTRREALERVSASANDAELDRATLETWMIGLNTVRLVLGTRLDVSEDGFPQLEPDDPELPAWALYEFLGVFVGMVVDALARTA
jgi:hypothetical protein